MDKEYKIWQERDILIDAAHGGSKGQNDSEKVIVWLKFVSDQLNWTDSRKNCISMGGDLFSKVNGTENQLKFLLSKLDNKEHWLGIYTEDHQIWKSVNGSTIENEKLFWRPGQPNNWNGKQYHVSSSFDYPKIGLKDIAGSAKHRSVCDLL